jgi:glycosyltransferase involved in cell wall biosynthesis
MKTLSIIIPAYNEEKTIHLILDKIAQVELTHHLHKEIVVVNDCSRDQTKQAVEDYISSHPDLNISYYEHKTNQGK